MSGAGPPSNIDFQGPDSFGNLISRDQFQDAISGVVNALGKHKRPDCQSTNAKETIDTRTGNRSAPSLWSSTSSSSDILSNCTFAQAFNNPYLERLYSLNVNQLMKRRYLLANLTGCVIILVIWTSACRLVSTAAFSESAEGKVIDSFNCVSGITCLLLAIPLLTCSKRLDHLNEQSCYASYALILALWAGWSYLAQTLLYQSPITANLLVTIDATLWASNLLFGPAVIMIMNLYLTLRSRWSRFVHLVYFCAHVAGVVATMPRLSSHNAWEYGILKTLPHIVLSAVCFYLGCERELEMRNNFLAWAACQATANKPDDAKLTERALDTTAERLEDRVRSCAELLEQMQNATDINPRLQQCILQLNSTIQGCLNQMKVGDNPLLLSLKEWEVRDDQQEAMNTYLWGSTERYGTKMLGSIASIDTTLEAQVSLAFGIQYAGLTQSQIATIEPVDEKTLASWDFNVLEFFKSANSPFISLGYGLLQGYHSQYDIKGAVLFNFLSVLESLYRDVPYHNRIHGAMVAQKVVCLARYTGLYEKMNVLEQAVMVVAALGHDVGHPARNNAFFVRTGHPLAQLYNDRAVLENFHAATLFKILRIPDCNLFAGLDYDSFRSQIIELVLATDTADHFQMVSQLRHKCSGADFNLDDSKNQLLLSKMLIKGADVSAPAMTWEHSLEWVERLIGELYSQGDEEASLGIPISALCDRANHSQVAKSQTAFLKLVVSPLYHSIALVNRTKPLDAIVERLEENIERWQKMHVEGETVACYEFDNYRSSLEVSWALAE